MKTMIKIIILCSIMGSIPGSTMGSIPVNATSWLENVWAKTYDLASEVAATPGALTLPFLNSIRHTINTVLPQENSASIAISPAVEKINNEWLAVLYDDTNLTDHSLSTAFLKAKKSFGELPIAQDLKSLINNYSVFDSVKNTFSQAGIVLAPLKATYHILNGGLQTAWAVPASTLRLTDKTFAVLTAILSINPLELNSYQIKKVDDEIKKTSLEWISFLYNPDIGSKDHGMFHSLRGRMRKLRDKRELIKNSVLFK